MAEPPVRWLLALVLQQYLDDHEGLGWTWTYDAALALARGDLDEARRIVEPHVDEVYETVSGYDWDRS